MGATLATLVDRVQSNAGETGVDFTPEAEIKQWIQEAHNRLAETGYLITQLTASLVANQLTYNIAGWIGSSSDRQVYELYDVQIRQSASGTAWYRLKPTTWDRIRRQIDGVEVTDSDGAFDSYSNASTPEWYCWQGDYIYLWPPSSYATTNDPGLRLTFAAAELIDDDGDATHLPLRGEDAVIAFCLSRRARKDGDLQTEAIRMGEFENIKREMFAWYSGGRSQYAGRIEPSEMRDMRAF